MDDLETSYWPWPLTGFRLQSDIQQADAAHALGFIAKIPA
jgi:hypothetical protein